MYMWVPLSGMTSSESTYHFMTSGGKQGKNSPSWEGIWVKRQNSDYNGHPRICPHFISINWQGLYWIDLGSHIDSIGTNSVSPKDNNLEFQLVALLLHTTGGFRIVFVLLLIFYRWEECLKVFSHYSPSNRCPILEMVEYLPECMKVSSQNKTPSGYMLGK